MRCPECGCEITLDTNFCPDCKSDFSKYSISQRKIVFNRPPKNSSIKKGSTVDSSNVNGYVVYEGQSINGGKLRKGSSSSRAGTRAVGYDVNTKVRQSLIKENRILKVDDKPSNRDYDKRRRIARESLDDFVREDYGE